MLKPFLDIHTHKGNLLATTTLAVDAPSVPNTDAILSIHNLSAEEMLSFNCSPRSEPAYSAGIHPWFARRQTIKNDLERLENLAKLPAIKLIGECGLDKLRGDFALQQEILPPQFEMAIKEDKPLITWSAWNEPIIALGLRL